MYIRRPILWVLIFFSPAVLVGGAGADESRSPAELGRQLIHQLGCPGCHQLADPEFAELGKTGPDLRRIAAKTSPGWTIEWLVAPRSLRPTTSMPHFFTEDERGEARAVVAYLWRHSETTDYPPAPDGDATRGEELFDSIGCRGCHLRDAGRTREDFAEPYRLHGPNLFGLGAKVDPGWLYAWLREPRGHDPETAMPDLRLTEGEAADLTAFLLSGSTPADVIVETEIDLDGDVTAGYDAIELYGCYGCHHISGFEEAGPHASELVSADGFEGHGILGLPDYGFSEGEIEAIAAALADGGTSVEPALAGGRRLVARYGCRGCHLIEGHGQGIAATVDEPGMLPPDLRGEGSRVQPEWLSAYLSHPAAVRLRAWLTARMPEYGFSEDEVSTAVAYFTALDAAELGEIPVAPPAPPTARSIALGREAYELAACATCHPATAEAAAASGSGVANLAPPLDIANQRLRYGWIGRFLEDPQGLLPGTRMPTFFPRSAAGELESPLVGALDSPLFAEPGMRMMEHFESEEELAAFLADADAVIAAISDYVWSLSQNGESR